MGKIEYQLKKKPQPIFNCFKAVCRVFFGKIKVVQLGDKVQDKCLYVCNHANKKGPLVYEMYLPAYCVRWGAGEMTENYKARFLYLRDVLYIQKNGVKKGKATIKALFEAAFSQFIYKGVKVFPTYHDERLVRTIKNSITALENNIGVMIFPEDSNQGYFDKLTKFFEGFVLLMERYNKKTKEDIPVRPVYYHKKKKLIVVGESFYYSDFINKGLNREQIAEFFCNQVNSLYLRIENGEFDKVKRKKMAKKLEEVEN